MSLWRRRAMLCSVHGLTAGDGVTMSSCLQPCWHWGWFPFRRKELECLHTCSLQRSKAKGSSETVSKTGKPILLPNCKVELTDVNSVQAWSTVELCPSCPLPCWGTGNFRQLWVEDDDQAAQVFYTAQWRWHRQGVIVSVHLAMDGDRRQDSALQIAASIRPLVCCCLHWEHYLCSSTFTMVLLKLRRAEVSRNEDLLGPACLQTLSEENLLLPGVAS